MGGKEESGLALARALVLVVGNGLNKALGNPPVFQLSPPQPSALKSQKIAQLGRKRTKEYA